MNPDRRIVSRGHGPSDDSGSDDEENLRVSKCLKTYEHIIDKTAGLSVFLPSVTKFIPERIKHSVQLPNKIEMFYDPTGNENQIKPLADEYGKTVYNNDIKCDSHYFARVAMEEKYKTKFKVEKDPIPKNIESDSLLFESRFECGNLAKATRITDTYYELRLRTDLYTSRHCQWYYFRVRNMKSDTEYRFSIVNFSKPDSQYSVGMKPVLYSETEVARTGVGWVRAGTEMTYFKDSQSDASKPPHYIMSFTMSFPHDNDTCYLAHCYPYKYTDLMEDLKHLKSDPVRGKCLSEKVLCQSLAGNDVPVVTITSHKSVGDVKYKQAVIITARVHPGESPSSWMMRGVLHYLTSDTEAAEALRRLFIFKIVPMLNPDGVIVGNTRCNLAGSDLNRQYKHTVKEAFPTVHHVKEMINKLREDDVRVMLYCDLHAHSRKYNMFMYGCENRKKSHKYLKEQIFPYMLHKNAKDRFNFEDCRFTVTRDKEGTGRIVFKNLGIMNSYTLEASYGGSNVGNKAYSHFTPRDYENVGRYFCETLLDFNDPSPPKEQLRYKILVKLMKGKSSATEPNNVVLSDYSSLSSSEQDYTDLDEETYNEHLLFQNVKKITRRKLRRKPIRSSIFKTRENSEDQKPLEEFSSSSSSSSELEQSQSESLPLISSRQSMESSHEKISPSDISEDEDAINIDVMKDFQQPRGSVEVETNNGTEFSASACQKIHSELLASVNQIYINLQDSGLKTNSSSSSSSLSANTKNRSKQKILKTGSVELKPQLQKQSSQRESRSKSITEITLKKKVAKKLANIKITDDEPSEEEHLKNEKPQVESRVQSGSGSGQRLRQKHFATTGKMEVIVKSKTKLKRVIKKRDVSDGAN